jgi:hypothetical protein
MKRQTRLRRPTTRTVGKSVPDRASCPKCGYQSCEGNCETADEYFLSKHRWFSLTLEIYGVPEALLGLTGRVGPEQ